ncbi:5-formyltetrahydrofolate cyclo-ligase [Rhodopirellula sallentina]|uniref:5-formyltetrahydrofolate cyclo-ligase n=1 Tax=Rhodopirellula sallentina SM41 TaxID=1263870 RepID=M5U9F8_9BACT|nr:5-formyltetrahydrofolate cyclo-ligase [Rhodopirellula sallentina]EMI54491.1 5-formyltetrahydrofolate cyclo-ligase [Rhodopirellula sallentina SM41]
MTASSTSPDDLERTKQQIRAAAHSARDTEPDKDLASRAITDRLFTLPQYAAAEYVLWYIDVRSETRTRHALPEALEGGKNVVVPYCIGEELGLFHLESVDELATGRFGILEPKESLRPLKEKRVPIDRIDLILVPGVAFDRQGGRIGHGKGYYDKLLAGARTDTLRVALAYECQLFDEIPMMPHDVAMNLVITETAVYRVSETAA